MQRLMPGSRFGRLVLVRAIRRAGEETIWMCRCDCGAETEARRKKLSLGQRKSCGCIQKERSATAALARARPKRRAPRQLSSLARELRLTWRMMLDRCLNPKAPNFANYGGRGIAVCERWRDSLETFATDVGPKPSPRHTLDRIENDGNYEPGNVRWATWEQQAASRRPPRRAA